MRKIIFALLAVAVVGVAIAVLNGCTGDSHERPDWAEIEARIDVATNSISAAGIAELEAVYKENHDNDTTGFHDYLVGMLQENGYETIKIEWKTIKPLLTVVYLDNTASMEGYLRPTTGSVADFVSTFNALRRIEGDTVQAYYVAENGLQRTRLSDMTVGINDRTLPVDRKDAYRMSAFLDTVVTRTLADKMHDVVSYFITDGIISGTNAQIRGEAEFNVSHAGTLSTDIAQAVSKLQGRGYGILITRQLADFGGDYITYRNTSVPYTGKRPYYVIAIAPEAKIKSLASQITDQNVFSASPVQNILVASVAPALPRFAAKSPTAEEKDGTTYVDTEQYTGGDFDVNLDLQSLPEYMRDEQTAKRAVVVTFNGQPIPADSYKVADNVLALKRPLAPGTNVWTARVRNVLPPWVESQTADSDLELTANDPKTFNLKYLIKGLLDGILGLPAGDQLVKGEASLTLDY